MESNFFTATPAQAHERTVYKVKNDRMGGFVPSWDAPKEPQTQGFDRALYSYAPQPDPSILSEVRPDAVTEADPFSFWDLLDMVNPLQHIPVVNFAYRAITGDEIKSVSKVIGGGVFGGPVGLASGLVNVLVEEETGRDLMGNVAALVGLGGALPEKIEPYNFEAEYTAYDDLPVALLSFAQTPMMPMNESYEEKIVASRNEYARVQVASGRTAGTIAIYS
ncbi:MAG: hypothetical protein COA45_06320 [Zetaproteobacteria bacterium]|nr:MAG: hypothetical protein COA45_06320 [Zetaproteobacteria bacterium]